MHPQSFVENFNSSPLFVYNGRRTIQGKQWRRRSLRARRQRRRVSGDSARLAPRSRFRWKKP